MTTRNLKTVVPSPNLIIRKMVLLALLVSPCYQPLLAAESPEWVYSVRPKDTLIQFSKRHLINPQDWRVLQQLNQIHNTYRMPIGSKMRVPLHLIKQSPAHATVLAIVGDVYQLSANQTQLPVAANQQLDMVLSCIPPQKAPCRFNLQTDPL